MLLSTRTIRDSVYSSLASCKRCFSRRTSGSFAWRVKHFFVVLFLFILPLFLLTRAPVPAYAVTSNTVNFQARLQTGGGAIAPDGYYNVRFNLYTASTGGTSLWTETRDYNGGSPDNRVRVANGYLTVNLGDVTSFPSTIPWDQQLYLTMNIGGTGTTSSWDGEMSPRLKLTAVPYAYNAKTASQLITTASGISSTLTLQAPTVGDQSFIIPDQGAAGTYTLLTGAAASGSYIQLQGTSPGTQQTGNFNISGTGIAASGLKTPTISLGTAGSTTGSIVLYNQNNTNKVNIVSGAQTTDLTLTVPNAGASSDEVCLKTLANCLGTGAGSGAANTSLSNLYQTNINTALNTTGGDLTLQTTTSGNIVLNPVGSISLSQNTTLAAGKTITITGSSTANRPASPNEGMLYYDTSTHQLLQYNGTKWVGDHSTATKIVAASDSTQTAKDSADYVATGTNDQTTIAAAIAALPISGGTVYLLPGTYSFGASLDITKDNVTLVGDGAAAATINRAFDGTSLANGGIVKVDADSVTVTNLTLNGNSATYNNSYDNGIYKSASYGGLNVNHVKLLGNKGSAVYLDGDTNNYNTDSVIADNSITTSYAGALYIDQGFDIQVSNNNISLPGGGDAISIASSDRITINGNTIKNAANGIIVLDSSHINVNANTVYYNNDKGINLNGGNESITISANTVVSNLVGIGLSGSSLHKNTDVTISGNTITSNGYEGVLLNDAVRANVTGNILNDNTGTSNHSSIRVNGSVDSSVTSNIITDTAGTGYAIVLEWYNAVNTYVSNNKFSGTGAESINNASATTIFANQMTSTTGDFVTKNLSNSTTAFQIQNASGTSIFTVDTTNNQLTVGNDSIAGSISISDGSSHKITIATGTQSGNYTLSLPTLTGNDTICLQSVANCSGSGSGVATIGALDGGTANADGASISSTTLYLQSATASYAGLVNTTAQTFAGDKTFSGNTTLAAGKVFLNNGATVNNTLALVDFSSGGSIGTAATTVDIYTSISVAQTTASQTLTIPSPTAGSSYGRMLYLSNIGTASFTLLGTPLKPGATATLVWSNTNGGASWQYAGSDGNSILNQTATTQTAGFTINGTGTAANFVGTTSLQAPLLDTASAVALNIGTTNASYIMIGQWGVDTSINGQLSVAGYVRTGTGKIDTTNSSTNLLIGTDNAASIQLGQWNVPTTVSGQLTVNGGSLTLGTTYAATTFVTPQNSSVSTRINIPVYDVPNFGQILAFGVSSSSSTSSRALSIFDARTSAHQPSLAIFNPAETDAVGFSWDGSNSVALMKTLGADIGLNINGTTAASFTASQVNINQNTVIASGKTLSVAGNTTISTTSTTALKIQNASSVALFTADTSTATITMGTGGNSVTFTGTGGLVATGTARHTKSIILSPEYAGAVLDAQSDSACSSAANGTMTAGYDSANRTNYYNWTSTQTTNQCYDVVVQVPIPADFSSWYGGGIAARTSSTSNSSYGIAMIDSTGAYDPNYGSSYASPGTLSTSWSNVATNVLSGTYTAGDYATFKIRMSAKNGANLQLGNITLYYYSSF